MKFNLKDWRKMYDKVHTLGKVLKESQVDWLGNPAPFPLPRDTQLEIESEINTVCQRSNRYLDQCDMKMPKPKWYYDRKDPQTWPSHESFKYGHLLEY